MNPYFDCCRNSTRATAENSIIRIVPIILYDGGEIPYYLVTLIVGIFCSRTPALGG